MCCKVYYANEISCESITYMQIFDCIFGQKDDENQVFLVYPNV